MSLECGPLIERLGETDGVFFSIEVFPPNSTEGMTALHSRIDSLARLEPLFVDITWTEGPASLARSLAIATHAQKFSGLSTMMHLTCQGMRRSDVRAALTAARAAGVRNIMALRGDPPGDRPASASSAKSATSPGAGAGGRPHVSDFAHAADLVKFIREEFGSFFGISVGAHPDKHPEAASYKEDLAHLKAKVDAGADLVFTQVVYDADTYARFVSDANAIGINVPIVPGVMPIYRPATLRQIVAYTYTKLPGDLDERVAEEEAAMKESGSSAPSQAYQDWAVKYVASLCRRLLDAGAPGLHFFSLNIASSLHEIVSELGLATSSSRRKLPWRQSHAAGREHESVRPIFWANRPKSYICRTESWSQFPRSRWGREDNLCYDEAPMDEVSMTSAEERKAMWGDNLVSPDDVFDVFAKYIEGSVPRLPWCEAALHVETSTISSPITDLNRAGFLTINSQPRVNGKRSDDEVFGWGGAGGYVYQKAYVECFCSPELLGCLLKVMSRFPSLTYTAVDNTGHTYTNHTDSYSVQAVTWGVFPGKEVQQPTVVDPKSFLVWKEEAFNLWLTQWAAIYEPHSASQEIIHGIHDTFFLVTIVDNDFVAGDVFAVFHAALEERKAHHAADAADGGR